MANKSKLTDAILKEIKTLASNGYNHTEIAYKLEFNRQTISYWIKKNDIKTIARSSRKNWLKEGRFIDICKKSIKNNEKIKLNDVLKELDLHPSMAQKILKKNPNLRKAVRSRAEASLSDKTLTTEEAQSRLPDQKDRVIEFKDGKYIVVTEDGFKYKKSSAKLHQGDPRDKCGSVVSVDKVERKLKTIGYEIVSNTYTIKKRPFDARHIKCGKIRSAIFDNFFRQECATCTNTGTSKVEGILSDWVESLGLETEKFRFKGKTKGKEIDIYIPSLKIGIEYCGLYWHNENSPHPRLRSYHYDKLNQSEEKKIRLITIFEDEWLYRNFQVRSYLKSILQAPQQRIYARKCEIKEVDKLTAKGFLENYHIQGKTVFKVAFGLYYKEELFGLITGNKHHRQNRNEESVPFVLNRLVFKDGVQVVGGASKLLKKLKEYAGENGYNKIISWSDNRWSQGRVYEKLGFELGDNLGPDYSYVEKGSKKRVSKQSCKKELLIKRGASGTMSNTEKELALSLGLSKIWDCGKKRWEIDL